MYYMSLMHVQMVHLLSISFVGSTADTEVTSDSSSQPLSPQSNIDYVTPINESIFS